MQIWHIQVKTQDDKLWVVYEDNNIQNALNKAIRLAKQLNTIVKIAESYGDGNLSLADGTFTPNSKS